jgi:hypothetical protein
VNESYLREIHHAFFKGFPFNDFRSILTKATEPHLDNPEKRGCLILDMQANTVDPSNPLARLAWFRADGTIAAQAWQVGNPGYFLSLADGRPTLPPSTNYEVAALHHANDDDDTEGHIMEDTDVVLDEEFEQLELEDPANAIDV